MAALLCGVEGAAPAVASYVFRCCSWGCSCFAFAGCRPLRPPRRLPQRVLCLGPAADEEPLEIGQTSALSSTGALKSAPVAKRYRRGLQTPLWSNPFVELLGAVADEGKLICAPQRPNIARRKLSQREWPQTSRRGAVLVFLGAPRDAPAAQAKKQDTSRGSQKSPCAAVSATPTASKRAPRTPVPRAPPLRAARAPPKMFASHR